MNPRRGDVVCPGVWTGEGKGGLGSGIRTEGRKLGTGIIKGAAGCDGISTGELTVLASAKVGLTVLASRIEELHGL